MKRNLPFLVCALLISTTTFPLFDLSPWIVIDNSTKFDFACEVEAAYYPVDSDNISVLINKDDNFNVSFDQAEDEDGNEYIKINIHFACASQCASVLNPMFYEDDELFNPKIKSVTLTHQSLQLTTFCYPTKKDLRYFSIEYQLDNGIIMKMNEISTYIKCLNNFKQTMRNVVLAALEATNWLPY